MDKHVEETVSDMIDTTIQQIEKYIFVLLETLSTRIYFLIMYRKTFSRM